MRSTMSGRHPIGSLVLILALTFVGAVKELNSIKDLKKITSGDTVPRHSLVLLYWFANTIEIDNNGVILLTFEPNNGDYGTHHYGNYEGLLDPLPRRGVPHRYYTLGNLNQMDNQNSAYAFPAYVTQNLHNWMEYEERNRARIIFRVSGNTGRQAGQRIDQVYITQHFESNLGQGTRYDPAHTYSITTDLLREIREFTVRENQRNSLPQLRARFGRNIDDSQLSHLQNTWGDLACLGLLLFIVITPRHYLYERSDGSATPPSYTHQSLHKKRTQPYEVINIPETPRNPSFQYAHGSQQMSVTVGTGDRGKARIYWSNIPEHHLKTGVMVVLFKNNNDNEKSKRYSIVDRASGSWDTSVPLNTGLQVRLHVASRWCYFWRAVGQELHRGWEFQNTRAEEPVNITGYDAKLQLFVKDGKACARLYVSNTFTEWRTSFKKSWIGFYTNATKERDEYESWQWQWATKMTRCNDVEDVFNYVYEYHSSMAIAPGVQARFIHTHANNAEVTCTPTW